MLIDPKKANCAAAPGAPIFGDTTYLTTIDKDGNIASWIQSLFSEFGSGVTVEGMGFLLHNPGNAPGIGAQVRVYNGIVIITDQGRTSAYKDSHALEQWLIEQARVHGQGETLKAVGK